MCGKTYKRGAYTSSNTSSKEKVGFSAGGPYRRKNTREEGL